MTSHNIPSIKRMTAELRLDLPTAELARRVMEAANTSDLESLLGVEFYGHLIESEHADRFIGARHWYRACHGRPNRELVQMYMLNDLLDGHGVEGQSAGTNAKSPSFEYVNMGDTYTATILYVYGRGFRISDWGTLIERGNYE